MKKFWVVITHLSSIAAAANLYVFCLAGSAFWTTFWLFACVFSSYLFVKGIFQMVERKSDID